MIEITDWRTRRRRKSLIPYTEMTEDEKRVAIKELMNFKSLMEKLELNRSEEVYILQSEKKMPAWLVDGTWQFHPDEIDLWLEEIGGNESIKSHLADFARRREEHERLQRASK